MRHITRSRARVGSALLGAILAVATLTVTTPSADDDAMALARPDGSVTIDVDIAPVAMRSGIRW